MYVSRIEITGFKSFVDRTVIELGPGISTIVGPNGCGKTNICDAIRWVLGEENVRLLRGVRIDDIIFNGTEKRKPTGMAEVSLTLSEVQDTLPLECHEVTITRRVFRSGESQFFINKVPSRLKDIVNLLLGTGLGRRGYSIMERDMIDWILDDVNGQRRRIIEEAAGISKYKVRRQETMNKLALTERDLERVEDLISEVERRVRSLARQAAKARRYERLVNRIREVETFASVTNYTDMRKRLDELNSTLTDLDTRLASCAKRIAVSESEIEKKKGELGSIEEEVTKRGEEIARITEEVQKLENERVVTSERKHAASERILQLRKEREQKADLIATKRRMLAQKQQEVREAEQLLEQLQQQRENLMHEFERANLELKSKRERSVLSTRNQLESVQQQIDAASRATEIQSRYTHLEELLKKLKGKGEDNTEKLAIIEREVDEELAALEQLKQARSSKENEMADLEPRLEELSTRLERIREERARLGEQAARAFSRYELLKDLVERYEGYDQGVRVLMEAGRQQGVHGVLGDMIRCSEPRYEPAVVAALSEALQYVVVDQTDHATSSVRMLKEKQEGSATFVILERVRDQRSGDVPKPDDGVIGRVVDFIDCDPPYRDLVEYLLGDIYLVGSLDDAFDLSNRVGDHQFGFVTPEGDGLFRGTIVRSGGNHDFASTLLGRRDKVLALRTEAEALQELAIEQAKAFEELTEALQHLKAKHDNLINEQALLSQEIADKEAKLNRKMAERDSLRRTQDELDREIKQLSQELENLSQELADSRRVASDLRIEQGSLFDNIDETTRLEGKVERLRDQLESNTGEMLKTQSQLNFLKETLEQLESEIAALEASLQGLDGEVIQLERRQQELDKHVSSVEGKAQHLLDVLAKVDEQRKSLFDNRNGLKMEIEGLRGKIKQYQSEREQIFTRKQEFQAESNLLEIKCDSLKQRMMDEYGVDITAIKPADLPECDDFESELSQLKERLRNLGPVNLIALEEYDVEKQRYDFLCEQRDDLKKARQSLDEAIVQINRRARLEFNETFEKVRQDFRKNFETLFEGGSADLRLEREHDPLESPIEILAQPSGKKLEHISLLSGGERALTAIAFLFAVYHTRPSPFCLLDEVDAPLDDANVTRFLNLIRGLSERTQFLIVTHNKKTMEAAACLYGVTMEEPGISKVVSVKLESAKNETLEPVG